MKTFYLYAWVVVLGLFLVACNGVDGGETAVSQPQPPPTIINIDTVPNVDSSLHSVPLEEIYFDTFRSVNRSVPLTEADEALIHSLRDAIPPIYEPVFETAVTADKWLSDSDLILGYAAGAEAFAYPIKILNFHEIVSHQVNGRPIMATYCPLCRSGVVYDRTVNGEVLLFGNTSALFESDMVMLDHQTGSYWVQVSGHAVVGTLTGAELEPLPSQMSSWAQWQAIYPNTQVLSRDTGYSRNYDRDPFSGYAAQLNRTGQFAFPVSEAGQDARLEPGAAVLGIQLHGETHAYPLDNQESTVINTEIGGSAVTVFIQSGSGVAYGAVVDGRSLTFSLQDGAIIDNETNSRWNLAGEAIAGELSGNQLTPLPTRTSLWFALIAAFPDLILHQP